MTKSPNASGRISETFQPLLKLFTPHLIHVQGCLDMGAQMQGLNMLRLCLDKRFCLNYGKLMFQNLAIRVWTSSI